MLHERNRRAVGEKKKSVLRSSSFSSSSGSRMYRPQRRGTLDNNTMKMEFYQGIPEETEKENLSKQYIQRDENFEKSKGDYGGVSRRIKKQNSQSSMQRPKSWHNTGISNSMDAGLAGSPSGHGTNYTNVGYIGETPSVNPYSRNQQQRSPGPYENDEHDVSPGFVKRRAKNYGATVNPSHGVGQGYELQPAIIYPQVVSAVQVQNTQAGRMPNGSSSSSSQQVPGMGIANYSMVQMPQKQYASTADVMGEKKIPPPLPTRVDSKNRTQQLSENHVKSSSWPATKPQQTSTDTPTQSSVISPTSLPPVRLSPSQEQVYPSVSSRSTSGMVYSGPRKATTISTTVSSSTDYQVHTAQPFVINEGSTSVTDDWFQGPKDGYVSPSAMLQPSSNRQSPPSPPTRDIDPESSSKKRGPRYNTSDSLYKDYEALLYEFEKHESSFHTPDSNAQVSSHSFNLAGGDNSDQTTRLSETAPVLFSSSFTQLSPTNFKEEPAKRRSNSFIGDTNERTWKNPNDFSATAPAMSVWGHNRKSTDSAKEDKVSEQDLRIPAQPVVVAHHGRPDRELSIHGNAPRNRTPINLNMIDAVDRKVELEGEKKRSLAKDLGQRKGDGTGSNYDSKKEPLHQLSSEDQRKLKQISSENSILLSMLHQGPMLHQDSQKKMNFFGGEDFDRKNGPEVASDQVEPAASPQGHYRQGSYSSGVSTSRWGLDGNQKYHLYSSSIQLSNHASMQSSTTPETKEWSGHARYHSFSGPNDFEVPDVSRENKGRLDHGGQQYHSSTELNQAKRLNNWEYSSESISKEVKEDPKHSRSDSDQTRRLSDRRRHIRKASDPQGETAIHRSLRNNDFPSWQNIRRSPPSLSQNGSNSSWSSHDSNRSSTGDHYSSNSSLVSNKGYNESRPGSQGRHSDLGLKRESNRSPRSSPVDSRNKVISVSRSVSVSNPTYANIHHIRKTSLDEYSKHPLASSPSDKHYQSAMGQTKQTRVPERTRSTSGLDVQQYRYKPQPETTSSVPRGPDRSPEVIGLEKSPGPVGKSRSPQTSTVFKFVPEPTIAKQDVQAESAAPLNNPTYAKPIESLNVQSYDSGSSSSNVDVAPCSPPPPPPPTDTTEIPEDVEFPPPPPDFLLNTSQEGITSSSKKNDEHREVLKVTRVDTVQVEPNSNPLKVHPPIIVKKTTSSEDISKRGNSPVVPKSIPQPDNREKDNKSTERDNKEKSDSESEDIEQSDGETLPEVNESNDPLVNCVLSFLSTSQHSRLRKLYPDSRKGKRKTSRPSTAKMPNVASEDKEKYSSRKDSLSPHEGPLSVSLTSYLQISPGRASLLKKARILQGSDVSCEGDDDEKLRHTKEELIERITRKVEELCNTQREVRQEIEDVEAMGRQLEETIKQTCPGEIQKKYTTYIGDLEKVTKLLINLSRKLTKVDSILHDWKGDNKENKENLEKMRSNYASQYEDAKNLKQSISQRHEDISSRLKQNLSSGDHEDFTYYIDVRCRLLIEAQDIDDKIQLGNEQIQALKASLEEHEKKSKESISEESKDVNGNCNGDHTKVFPS
ncbi:Protein Shroom3 [Holothuria leucospilota]|uniref:Protein Shroom3 n=1 Tax=Holothuria leucospilota TaxID=206669 RepID=A0A9Q1BK67_HOLLE|nr:Protein Shroom3 [Holothuria leucospilota]